MRVDILGIPSSDGTEFTGCEKAPDKLRETGLLKMISEYMEVRDLGNFVQADPEKHQAIENNKIINYNKVVDYNRELASRTAEVMGDGNFALFLGGDHSISLGSITGVLRQHPNTAVIWLDAHADLNTDITSPSRRAHGMPAAALLGYGDSHFCEITEGSRLNEKNLFLLGQRGYAIDEGEARLIGVKHIFLKPWKNIRRKGITNIIEDMFVILKRNEIKRVHLSFDLDVISGEYLKGVGTPVEEGPDAFSVKVMLRAIAGSGLLKSMDFVELNPDLDKDESSARLSVELLEEIFKYLR